MMLIQVIFAMILSNVFCDSISIGSRKFNIQLDTSEEI